MYQNTWLHNNQQVLEVLQLAVAKRDLSVLTALSNVLFILSYVSKFRKSIETVKLKDSDNRDGVSFKNDVI